VLVGRRNLQPELIPGFCRGLGFSSEAADYLALLVRAAHPLSPVDRAFAERQLSLAQARWSQRQPAGRIAKIRTQPVSSLVSGADPGTDAWTHPIIRALTACEGFRDNPVWVSAALLPALGPVQAAATLDLVRAKDASERSFDPRRTVTVVPWDPDNPALVQYHRETLGIARWALHHASPKDKRFRTAVWSIPSSQFECLRAEVERFKDEVEAMFIRACRPSIQVEAVDGPEGDESALVQRGGPNVVYQLMVQVFPLSQQAG
jgi:hypothetical protein